MAVIHRKRPFIVFVKPFTEPDDFYNTTDEISCQKRHEASSITKQFVLPARCTFNSPNFNSPNAGVLPIYRISVRRIPFCRIPILGLGLGIGLVLGLRLGSRFGDSGYGEVKFGELKFGKMKFGEMKRNRKVFACIFKSCLIKMYILY